MNMNKQQETKCYYCDGKSACRHIGLYEGEGGYREDDTRFRVICANCYPLINHQGGRSWSVRFTYDNISIQPKFIDKIIKFITDQDTDEEEDEEVVIVQNEVGEAPIALQVKN